MVQRERPTRIWIESDAGISDPFDLNGQAFHDIFAQNPEAKALWILRPWMREPDRFPWRMLFEKRRRGRKGKLAKKEST